MGTLSLFILGTGSRKITNSRQFMREACKFNVRIHNGNILMSYVTKYPGVSSILLFSGSGINFPRPLYMLGEDGYGGMPFPLLPVAAGYPAGGQPAHWQTSEHMSGIQDIKYMLGESGVPFPLLPVLLVIQLGGSLLIDKHQNMCQVYWTWNLLVEMCTVACLSYQWLLVIQLGGSLHIDKHQNICQVCRT